MEEEYRALAQDLGFSRQELGQLAKNGFEVALVDNATRASWIAEVDEVLAK